MMGRLYVADSVMYDLVCRAGNYVRPDSRGGVRVEVKMTSASGAGGAL